MSFIQVRKPAWSTELHSSGWSLWSTCRSYLPLCHSHVDLMMSWSHRWALWTRPAIHPCRLRCGQQGPRFSFAHAVCSMSVRGRSQKGLLRELQSQEREAARLADGDGTGRTICFAVAYCVFRGGQRFSLFGFGLFGNARHLRLVGFEVEPVGAWIGFDCVSH